MKRLKHCGSKSLSSSWPRSFIATLHATEGYDLQAMTQTPHHDPATDIFSPHPCGRSQRWGVAALRTFSNQWEGLGHRR